MVQGFLPKPETGAQKRDPCGFLRMDVSFSARILAGTPDKLTGKGVTMEQDKKVTLSITEQEHQVIKLIRELGYGELSILVKDGKPYRVEEIRKSIQIK